MLTKIVVGVDGSPRACDAAALGQALAEAGDADLLLVGVYPDPLLPFPPALAGDSRRAGETRDVLAAVRPKYAPSAHTRVVADFSAARALRRVARDERADVLVLGSSRQAAEGTVRAGRAGRQVLHHAPCAVAFAVAGAHERPGPLRRIVVGMDEGPEAEVALEQAILLAGRSGAAVEAVAVADDRPPVEASAFGVLADLPRWDEVVEARRAHLERHIADQLRDREGVTLDVRTGDPVEELGSAARGADLLIVGSRRWGTFERVVVGSTAEELCAEAPCSVLVVPRPSEERAAASGATATAPTTAQR